MPSEGIFDAGEKQCILVKRQPVTGQHRPFVPKVGDQISNYGTARANIAVSQEAPNGTTQDNWNEKHKHQTVLEQHCEYFDRDHDGIIWPWDTYCACRDWGWGIALSLFFASAIHIIQSYGTVPGWLPDTFFRIYIKNMYRNKHGSGAETFDSQGRYRPQQFEDFFNKYDRDGKGGLTAGEVWYGLRSQKMGFDIFGQASALFEWGVTYLLLWPEDGVLKKDDVRRVCDGSIFFEKARQHRQRPTTNSGNAKPGAG